MKKILFAMLLVILLARVPLDKWREIPDKTEFLRLLGVVYCEQTECKKALIGVIEKDGEALFFADCLPNEVSL